MNQQGNQKKDHEARKAADTEEKSRKIVHSFSFSDRRQILLSKVPPKGLGNHLIKNAGRKVARYVLAVQMQEEKGRNEE